MRHAQNHLKSDPFSILWKTKIRKKDLWITRMRIELREKREEAQVIC